MGPAGFAGGTLIAGAVFVVATATISEESLSDTKESGSLGPDLRTPPAIDAEGRGIVEGNAKEAELMKRR